MFIDVFDIYISVHTVQKSTWTQNKNGSYSGKASFPPAMMNGLY